MEGWGDDHGELKPLVVVRLPMAAALQLNGDIPFKVSCRLAPRLDLPVQPPAERWLGLPEAIASPTGHPLP